MKSKVKFAALVLVIWLLGLAILTSPVFGGKPEPKLYTIVIGENITCDEFLIEGNKSGTGFTPYTDGVTLTFVDILPPDDYLYVSTETYPERCFRWSPLEDDYWNLWDPDPSLCTGKKHLQILNKIEWEFHHIKITGNNSLECRFDLKVYEYEGVWDHYILGINMESWESGKSRVAMINWTHYTEWSKPPKGKKPKIEFQHLTYPSPGQLTITITEVL